jgi:hypothetical protein
MSGPQLCRTLLDPKKNHGMDLAKLEQHLATLAGWLRRCRGTIAKC